MLKQIKFVGVPTRDQDRALAFWTNVMGFQIEFAQPPRKESWGTAAIFKDPDGNTFVIGS